MTKKDFELIARVIRRSNLSHGKSELAVRFANELQNTNPRFDRGRFIAAAMQRG